MRLLTVPFSPSSFTSLRSYRLNHVVHALLRGQRMRGRKVKRKQLHLLLWNWHGDRWQCLAAKKYNLSIDVSPSQEDEAGGGGGENLAMISSPVTEVNLLLNLAAVSGTRGRRRRELVVASSSASQALNLCAHHPHINSVHRFSRMVMRLGNLSHRICPNSFRALGSQS